MGHWIYMSKEKKLGDILCENILALMEQRRRYSMRRLSLEIGASDSYIQKILSQKARPSLDKIDDISNYFGCESWELFYDYDTLHVSEYIEVVQMVSKMPEACLPFLRDYMEFLLSLGW